MVEFRPAASARSGRMPIPQRSRGGSDIARGIGQVGDALFNAEMQDRQLDERDRDVDHQLEMAELARNRQATLAIKAGDLAELQGRLSTYELEQRVKPGAAPGAVGHTKEVANYAQQQVAEYVAGLGNDPEVIDRLGPQARNLLTDMTTRAQAFEIGEFSKFQGAQGQKYVEAKKIAVQGASFDKLIEAIEDSTVVVDGMGMTGNSRVAFLNAAHGEMVGSWIDHRMASGQHAEVRELLKKGILDPFMTAEMKDKYYTEADRADERAARVAEAQAARQEDDARETLKQIRETVEAGADPTPAQMAAAQGAAKLLPESEQIAFTALTVQTEVNRNTRDWAAPKIRAQADYLRGRVASGKASQNDQMELQALDKRYDAQTDREAAELKELGGEGRNGDIAVLSRLRGQDRDTAFTVGEKFRDGFGHIAMLPTEALQIAAAEGRRIRADRPELIDKDAGKSAFASTVGTLSRQLGEQYGAKMDVAMDLYANWAARTGTAKFDKAAFGKYVNVAMGATQRRDGAWQGGIGAVNGRQVLLPDGLTAPELRSTMARTDWSAARGRGQTPVSKAYILAHTYPEVVDETPTHMVYNLVDESGADIVGANRQPLVWRVAKAIR